MHRYNDLPDPAICRTRHFCDNYRICLAKESGHCRYRFNFGNELFCKHVENYDFSEELNEGG